MCASAGPPRPKWRRCSRYWTGGARGEAACAPWERTRATTARDSSPGCAKRGIAPHIARITGRISPGLDGRTTRHAGYGVSQRKRKRIEEIFGWMKSIGGLRRTRFVGIAKTQLAAYLVGAAYNLMRLARLAPATG
jgi:IS5 family transposase